MSEKSSVTTAAFGSGIELTFPCEPARLAEISSGLLSINIRRVSNPDIRPRIDKSVMSGAK
jgi:hypothetical protein